MHIVYLIERIDKEGDIQRSLTTRVNYLVKKYNYEITIICTEKDSGVPAYSLNNNVKLLFLENLTSKNSLFGRIMLRYQQSKMILSLKPDIIISTKYTLHNLFFRLLGTNVTLISEMREVKENYNLYRNKSFKTRVNAIIRDYTLKKQNIMIVLTERDRLNWNFDNIKVVPNPQTIQSDIVSELKSKQVLALGRLDKVKGFDKLIEVWSIVHRKHPDWKLKICGEGEEFNNLFNKIKEFNLQNSIILTNKFMPVIQEFLNSSIFVLSSQFESFGNVMVESKVCGVPIVAFDAPNGPKEIIINNEDGFVVELNNIDAMASKINYLIENPEMRMQMGKAAKQNSIIYDPETVIEYYNKIITAK